MTQADAVVTESRATLPPLVERTLARLIRAFAPERVLLFGSWAKGAANDRSDVDLLLVARTDGNPVVHLRRARQLASDCFPPVDVVIASPTEVAEAATARSPFLASILSSGITIYRQPTSRQQSEP